MNLEGCSYEKIHNYLNNKYGFGDTPGTFGVQLIDREGKYLNSNKFHPSILHELKDAKIINVDLSTFNYIYSNIFTEVGFIRCNNMPHTQCRYLQLPKHLTEEQLETLEGWLDLYLSKGYHRLDISNEVKGNNKEFIYFQFNEDNNVDDLMKILYRYNNTGKLINKEMV